MHEMALTRDVVDIVLRYAEAANAKEVRTVYLTIGHIRDIVEDLFEGCFAYMARNTVAEHAELVITRIPFTVRCNSCGCVYHLNVRKADSWKCPSCNERNYKLNTGMEFFVNNIEIAEASPAEVRAR